VIAPGARLLGLPEGTPVEMVTLLRLMFDEAAAAGRPKS
jgi:hypothetical protein